MTSLLISVDAALTRRRTPQLFRSLRDLLAFVDPAPQNVLRSYETDKKVMNKAHQSYYAVKNTLKKLVRGSKKDSKRTFLI